MANFDEKEKESICCKALSRRQFLERSMVGGFAAGLGSVTNLSALVAFA
jgi:hypothetical protein